ncbi:MAG: Uma2 family endonuclease [Synechococcales bacterium]|nr:Uma2 family endonuclease [Synechococcales bacterium]
MPLATNRKLTLSEFLAYDDGSDRRYELVDGVIVEMGAESTLNTMIAMYLIFAFGGLGIPHYQIGLKQLIEVPSRYATARDPDLIIHSEASALALSGRKEACLKLEDPHPLLVIEIVSQGTESSDNYQRDYVKKSQEYAAREIPEYWLVDPQRQWVKVGRLIDGGSDRKYDFLTFQGEEAIVSPTFAEFKPIASQVLSAGK